MKDIGIAAQPMLNEALHEDRLESGGVGIPIPAFPMLNIHQILRISIYLDLDHIPEYSFGRRSTVYPGKADLKKIMAKEISPDGKLEAIELNEAIESGFHHSSAEAQPIARSEHQLSTDKTLELDRIPSTRLSELSVYSTDELSVYSTDEFRSLNKTDMSGNDEQTPVEPEDDVKLASDGRMIILGEL